MSRKSGLGRGLEALLGDINATTIIEENAQPYLDKNQDSKIEGLRMISIHDIDPNVDQPRKDFDKEKLEELAQSIKENGIIQPIIVKETNDRYTIIAGERRWRASRIAQLRSIPAIVRNYSDIEIMEIALIENLQREDLNPIEEAIGYQKLQEINELTQEELAQKLGKSRPAIANALRLLNLPDEIKEMLRNQLISSGHARALLSIHDRNKQLEIAQKILKEGISVREVEKLAKAKQKIERNIEIPVELKEAAKTLQNNLETKVKITGNGHRGQIQIEYYTDEQLEDLYKLLAN